MFPNIVLNLLYWSLTHYIYLLRVKPLMLDALIVKSSGTDVEKPATFPTVVAFKSKLSANSLKYFTNIYLDIITIKIE